MQAFSHLPPCLSNAYTRRPHRRLAAHVRRVYNAGMKMLATEKQDMGRLIAAVRIENASDATKVVLCDALVDTDAAYLVLPTAWKDRLAPLETIDTVDLETATQDTVRGEICGPVKIQIEGFRPVYNEVLFLDMHPEDGIYEPLIGYLILEQSQAAVDMLGHRLIHVKHVDLK